MQHSDLLNCAFAKIALHWSKDIERDILAPGHKYPLSYLTGEAGELVDAVRKWDVPNMKEEVSDVLYAAGMIPAQRLGINLPLIGGGAAADKFYARKKVWDDLFAQKDIKFNNAYLTGGSNYRKPSKIVNAFQSAGHAISEDEAVKMLSSLGIEPEDGTGYSNKERVLKLLPQVNSDPAFRKNELIKKLQELSETDDDKAYADVHMAKLWADAVGADTSDTPIPNEAHRAGALSTRLAQLEDRINTTGSLYSKTH